MDRVILAIHNQCKVFETKEEKKQLSICPRLTKGLLSHVIGLDLHSLHCMLCQEPLFTIVQAVMF